MILRSITSTIVSFSPSNVSIGGLLSKLHSKQFFVTFSSEASLPQKIAIVGSGPSGCYTAKYLLSSFQKKYGIQPSIDVIERLPVPYGLVRYGVAPDHPEVKNVQNDFDLLFQPKDQSSLINDGDNWRSEIRTSRTPEQTCSIKFYGNVLVGGRDGAPGDLSIQELRELYDIVILSYGCESDRKLGIDGEDLEGVISAREFVAWYNGHPDYVHIGEKVSKALRSEDFNNVDCNAVRQVPVVVVGQGNVALDCARILAKGSGGLFDTDIASHALSVLGGGVSNVSVIGRRGHAQGAFTIKELRELVNLEQEGHDTSFVVRNDELDMGLTSATQEELDGALGRPKLRMQTLLRDAAMKVTNTSLPKRINLRFLVNPIKFIEMDANPVTIGSVVCERTRLVGDAGRQVAIGTGEFETMPANLVLVSIGYKATIVPGTEVWFDSTRGILRNLNGLIEKPSSGLAGIYVSGWLKRGPSGIIGTNIVDAKDTVATIIKDVDEGSIKVGRPDDTKKSLAEILKERNVRYVDWNDTQRIAEHEHKVRRTPNQPREKLTNIQQMLEVAGKM